MKLLVTDYALSVCKLKDKQLPAWVVNTAFLTYTATSDEISLVCESSVVPSDIQCVAGWTCIKVDEILDFSMVGIIAHITQLLAGKHISVFVISTYDTDYILVKRDKLELAVDILKNNSFAMV